MSETDVLEQQTAPAATVIPSEFDQLWRVALIGKKHLTLDLTEPQKAMKAFLLAVVEAPIQDYEEDLEKGEDCDPMGWYETAIAQMLKDQPIEELPDGWPEGMDSYGGSPELQKAQDELKKVRAELAAAKTKKPSKAASGAGKSQRTKKEKVAKEKKVGYAQIISYFVLTHPGMSRDQMTAELQKEHPGTTVRMMKGVAETLPLINPATVGLHMYLWRDKAADLKRAFPDQDWSFLGW
jgi:hypothetical protein